MFQGPFPLNIPRYNWHRHPTFTTGVSVINRRTDLQPPRCLKAKPGSAWSWYRMPSAPVQRINLGCGVGWWMGTGRLLWGMFSGSKMERWNLKSDSKHGSWCLRYISLWEPSWSFELLQGFTRYLPCLKGILWTSLSRPHLVTLVATLVVRPGILSPNMWILKSLLRHIPHHYATALYRTASVRFSRFSRLSRWMLLCFSPNPPPSYFPFILCELYFSSRGS